jgi:hypothetical protein
MEQVMKPKAVILILTVIFSLSLTAMDITTTDGKIYKNVKVLDSSPISIDISYKSKKGQVIQGIKLAKLPKDLQKKYNYSAKKAAEFTKKIKLYEKKKLAEAHKQAIANAQFQKTVNKDVAKIDHIKAMIYAQRMQDVQLKVIRVAQTGVVAFCKAEQPSAHSLLTGNYGKVFILGKDISSGAQWWGNIYPINTTISLEDGVFPVYATSLTKATNIVLEQK